MQKPLKTNTMKKHILTLSLAIAVLFIFNSCGKYEEGPGFSLRTKTSRLTGIWKIEKQYLNGTEVALDEATLSMRMEIVKDGTGKMTATALGMTISVNLEWEFSSDKENIKMRVQEWGTTNWGEWDDSEILKLTNKEFWIKDTETVGSTTDETIIHFAKE